MPRSIRSASSAVRCSHTMRCSIEVRTVSHLTSAVRWRDGCGAARRCGRTEGVLMQSLPPCPQCASSLVYEDGPMLICPECAHEWAPSAEVSVEDTPVYRDANGVVLTDGDTVTVIKDLKVKGASQALKAGTKVKNIRLVGGDHDIDCRIDGFGAMKLKSEFVRKV